LKGRLAKGGMGWGHAKEELFEAVNNHVREMRERYVELRKDEAGLKATLAEGAEKARALSNPTLTRVRHAMGIR
jgi:tryptophanyl-tRNA synthetase